MDGLGQLSEATFAFVDVETTGLSPHSDRVVEVACIVSCGGRRIRSFETLVNPERPIPLAATSIHGIAGHHVRRAPVLAAVIGRLRAETRGTIVVAHNAAFDARFLPFLSDRRWLCSMRFARIALPSAPAFSNQALRSYLRIRDAEMDELQPHSAFADALVTSRVFERCVEQFLGRGHRDSVAHVLHLTALARPFAMRVMGESPTYRHA